MINPNQPTLVEMISELDAAIRAGDRTRADELQRQILQRLSTEAARHGDIERRVRAMMAELENSAVLESPLREVLPGPERSARGTEDQGCVCPVWFATNRGRNEQRDGFTSERHDEITHGRVDVFVPRAHRFGETGSGFWSRLRRRDLRDDRLRVQHIEVQAKDDFFEDIDALVEAVRDRGARPQALVFLHGYNMTFEEAAVRAAQMHVDLDVAGATAFFSWPSRGSVLSYAADEASIEASEGALTRFLIDFVARCNAEKVHVIAHSMGNRGLLRALQRIAASAETSGKVKFGQLFLAAPDVDRDLFLDLAHLYRAHADRATLYASTADRAVQLSSVVHDAPRAGYYAPYTVAAGIDTVAVPDFDIDHIGHSYFARAAALLHDMYVGMRFDAAPPRQRMVRGQSGNQAFWVLRN